MHQFISRLVLSIVAGFYFLGSQAQGIPLNFSEAGTTVNGYQDYFEGVTLNPDWLEFDGGNDDASPIFTLNGSGRLQVAVASGDPNKLLYNPGTAYSNSQQEVLAMIRVTNFGTGDGPRGGITTVSNTGNGQGINYNFRDEGANARHTEILNDAVAWGPEWAQSWSNNVDYWVRMSHNPDLISGADPLYNGTNDVWTKIWLADGVTPEPTNWQQGWDYGGNRNGLAGLVATSVGGLATFEVDYILIKANGLPTIEVEVLPAPEPGTLLLAVTGIALLSQRKRGKNREASVQFGHDAQSDE